MKEAVAASLAATASQVPLTVPDDPCRVLLSATGLVARVAGAEAVPRTGERQRHDALTSQVPTTARSRVGVVTDTGRLVVMEVLSTPEVPRLEGAPSLAGGQPVGLLVDLEPGETVVGLVPVGEAQREPVVLATAGGVIKRVKPGDEPARGESWEVISLADGDRVVFAGIAADTDVLTLVTDDAQLLRFEASKVRPQGRGAAGMAGISLHEGARVIAGASVPAELLAEAVVVTIADAEGPCRGWTRALSRSLRWTVTRLRDGLPAVCVPSASFAARTSWWLPGWVLALRARSAAAARGWPCRRLTSAETPRERRCPHLWRLWGSAGGQDGGRARRRNTDSPLDRTQT